MKEHWKEEIRQKMADYEEPAPEVSWDEIEKAVAGQRQKAWVVPMWLREVAVAALLLTIAVVGYKALEKEVPITEKLTEVNQRNMNHGDRILDSVQNHGSVPLIHKSPLFAKVRHAVRESFQPKSIAEAEEVAETGTELTTKSEVTPEPKTTTEDNAIKSVPSPSKPQPPIYPSDLHKSPASKSRLTAKLYLSNAMGNSEHFSKWNYNVYRYNHNSGEMDDNESDSSDKMHLDGNNNQNNGNEDENGSEEGNGNGSGNDNQQGITRTDKSGEMITETFTATQQSHHYQPIRYGFSLRYSLNERWAVETGLTYTLLTSDITTTDAEKTTLSKQRLNYIGIPLKVEYLLWSSRYFNAYISVGALVEKMVKGRLETIETGTDESVSIHPLQCSVNGAVGAEFNLSRQFSIYAEPGIGYYFDNGSSVPTFYQDKPASFNLNVGLRFSFK